MVFVPRILRIYVSSSIVVVTCFAVVVFATVVHVHPRILRAGLPLGSSLHITSNLL